MTNVDLVEWQTLEPEASSLKGIVPIFDRIAERTVVELQSTGKLEILQLRTGIKIRASSWVGRVTLGNLTITVRPKIEGAPLLNLLRYSYSLRDLETFSQTKYDIAHGSFQDLIVVRLADEIDELLSRGLHRHYMRFDHELARPSGRINFVELARNIASAKSPLYCTYFNRSDRVLLNCVLLAGLRLAARVTVDKQLTVRVLRLTQVLAESVPVIQLTSRELGKARKAIDRRTTAYRSALVLINILLEGMGTSIGESSEMVPLGGFLFDMNRFFQALISRFLHDELADFSIQDEHTLKGIFEYDKANNPRRHRAIVPRPDFAVLSHGKVIEFLDTKYIDLWETPPPANILYQLVIYAMSKSTSKPRSTILFPTLAAEAVEQVILLKDPKEGSRRAEVVLRPVNLFELEKLTRPRMGTIVAQQRRKFAHALAFGAAAHL